MSYDKASSGIKPTTREPRIAIRIGVQRCSHCGAPIVPPGLALTPVQRRIVAVVQRRGEVSAEDLRAAVWADDADGGPENLKTLHVHIYLLNKKLRRDRQTVARIVNTVRAIEAATKQKAVLIIVDTVSRALAGGDENSSKDMGELITTIGGIQQNTSAAALLLHHVPHEGDRMRGHGNLLGAVDTTVHVVKGIVFRTATVIKANDSNEGEQVGFTLESIELPGGAQAPVVVPVEVGSTTCAGSTAGSKVNSNQKRFLDILRLAVLETPADLKNTNVAPIGMQAVTRDNLKRHCVAKGWMEEAESNKARAKVSDMLNALAGKHLIGLTDQYVWLAS